MKKFLFEKDKSVSNFDFYLIIIIFSILFAISYVLKEDHLYFWDYDGYYSIWRHSATALAQSPYDFFKEVFSSIKRSDYNCSVILPLIPFYFIFSGTRIGYILGITLIYLIPVAFLFTRLAVLTMNGLWRDSFNNKFFFLLCVTFAPFWAVILRGYPDISGLIFILISVIVCIEFDLTKRVEYKLILSLAFCFWLTFLFRRWYAYTIVSLYVSLPLLNYFLHNRVVKLIRLKYSILNFSICYLLSFVLVCCFQSSLLKRIISTDYSQIYSAYQLPFFNSLWDSVRTVGLAFFILSILFYILALKFSNRSFKIITFFYVFNLTFTFLIFTRTQAPGMQHLLPIELWLLLIGSCSFIVLSSLVSDHLIKKVFSYILLSASILILFITCGNCVLPQKVKNFLPYQRPPLKFAQIENYKEMVEKIKSLTKNNDKVSIFSSSAILNEEILDAISFYKLGKNIERTSQVDLRDKLNFNPYFAKYIVVTSPVQTHLPKETQAVITVPAQSILNGIGIGKAYKLISHGYKLDHGVTAYIYEKVRPFTNEEVDGLLNNFFTKYPHWKAEYDRPLLRAFLTSKIQLGDNWGKFSYLGNNLIEAHPGDTEPTLITWTFSGIKKIKFTSNNLSCNVNDPILIRLKSKKFDTGLISLPKGKTIELEVEPLNHKVSELFISKNKSSGCDSVLIFPSEN